MSKFEFDLRRREVIDKIRDPIIYKFNMAKHLALLSNDPAIIRRFYQIDVMQYFKDPWLIQQIENSFFRHFESGQAFAYFGLIPMIVNGKVNLVASGGFKCKSDKPLIDEVLNRTKDEANLQELFTSGVYWESGIGDFAYRLSFAPDISDKPLIDIIEPHHLKVNYNRGKIVSFVIKEVSDEDPRYELHEIHFINEEGFLTIAYRFMYDGKYIAPNDEAAVYQCRLQFPETDTTERVLPFRDFVTIVYKQNANCNKLYKGERGVPTIQGLDTIEEALTETLSDLIDAIRKGGIKEYIDDSLIPQNADGENLLFNPFNKRIIKTRGSAASTDGKDKLWQVTKEDIRYESYTETIKMLMSTGINKAVMSPTTIGLTGLESINSSADSQEAREKTSIRTRELDLKSWETKLRELFNKYLQVMDYINDREIYDYSDLIQISFDEYINPSTESVTEVLSKQVAAGLKSKETAINDLNPEGDEKDAQKELAKIKSESVSESQTRELNMGIPPSGENP